MTIEFINEKVKYEKSDEFQYRRMEIVLKHAKEDFDRIMKMYKLNDYSEISQFEQDGKIGHEFDDGWLLGQLQMSKSVSEILGLALENHSGYQEWLKGRKERLGDR